MVSHETPWMVHLQNANKATWSCLVNRRLLVSYWTQNNSLVGENHLFVWPIHPHNLIPIRTLTLFRLPHDICAWSDSPSRQYNWVDTGEEKVRFNMKLLNTLTCHSCDIWWYQAVKTAFITNLGGKKNLNVISGKNKSYFELSGLKMNEWKQSILLIVAVTPCKALGFNKWSINKSKKRVKQSWTHSELNYPNPWTTSRTHTRRHERKHLTQGQHNITQYSHPLI